MEETENSLSKSLCILFYLKQFLLYKWYTHGEYMIFIIYAADFTSSRPLEQGFSTPFSIVSCIFSGIPCSKQLIQLMKELSISC